jgi:hypothetical protein
LATRHVGGDLDRKASTMGLAHGVPNECIFLLSLSSTIATLAPVRIERSAAPLYNPPRRLKKVTSRSLWLLMYMTPNLFSLLGIIRYTTRKQLTTRKENKDLQKTRDVYSWLMTLL